MSNEWRCEKCDASYPEPVYRYILSLSVSDHTGQMWLQAFNDQAEKIMEATANDMMKLKDSNEKEFSDIVAAALFNEFSFKVRAKAETYQDDIKVRSSIVDVSRIDFAKVNREMITRLDALKL